MRWIFILMLSLSSNHSSDSITRPSTIVKIERMSGDQCKALHDLIHAAKGVGKQYQAFCIGPKGTVIGVKK